MNTESVINLKNQSEYPNISELLNYSKTGDFLKDMFEKVQKMTLFIKKLKLVEDPKYYESRSKEYAKLLKSSKAKIEKIIMKTILFTSLKDGKLSNIGSELDLKDFKYITDSVDDLLEKVSDNIDILKGKKKDKKDAEIEEELKNIQTLKNKNSRQMDNFNLKNKLDMSFIDNFDIDNSYFPFIPKIKIKPHAIKELSADIIDARKLRNENLEKFKYIKFEDRKESREVELFAHPYKEEVSYIMGKIESKMEILNDAAKTDYKNKECTQEWINTIKFEKISISEFLHNAKNCDQKNKNFTNLKLDDIIVASNEMDTRYINSYHNLFFNNKKNTPSDKLLILHEIEYLPLEQTRFIYVETFDSLIEMINEIEAYAKEIAVDLEHHSLESFLGLTCLMQISTRFTDYIVDTIKLRGYLQELNRVFCNPNIVKVLHGADYDIEWLQKDFGLYIVNMFDTGQAARILQFPSYSLAWLLSSVCNVIADKKYQLADWRLRPIPAEMMKYAREDTHYLLYIYDCLKRNLIQKSIVKNDDPTLAWLLVCKKSNELTLKQYVKPCLKSFEYFQMLGRNSHLSIRQKSLLKLLFKFRDYVARKIDLSPHLVLSQRNLFNLVKLPELNLENIYLNLDKTAHIRNFVPDLVKQIDDKLIRNEKKIEKGNFSKVLEQNYLDNMRGKLNNSKIIVSKVTVKLSNKSLTLNEVKNNGKTIMFAEKNKSKFFENKNNEAKEKTGNIMTSNKDDYENLINKFNNFNIIAFLQDKHPKFNIKIESKIPVTKTIKPEQEKISQKILEENIKINKEELFLKQKRKAGDEIPMIDLTDYKRNTNLFNTNNDSAEESDEDFEREKVNTSKNMQKSEVFIKKLMNTVIMQKKNKKK